MSDDTIILSIKPQYAEKIFEGSKTVELRRVFPKRIKQGTLTLIYVSSPVKSLYGSFKVVRVIKKPLQELWKIVHKKAGVTVDEFNTYYEGTSIGVAIFFTEVRRHPKPIGLKDLRKKAAGFTPPQGFRYTSKKELTLPHLAKFFS